METTDTLKKDVFELDILQTGIETNKDKLKTILNNVENYYFDKDPLQLGEKDSLDLLYKYKQAQNLLEIAVDYTMLIEKDIESLNKLSEDISKAVIKS